jgi:hypothetical protein
LRENKIEKQNSSLLGNVDPLLKYSVFSYNRSMTKYIFIFSIFIILSQTTLWAQEGCDENRLKDPTDNISKFASDVAFITAKTTDNNNKATVEVATTYLMAIKSRIDFKDNESNAFISQLTPICNDSEVEAKFRSKACTILSGIHGKIAQKLQLAGIENGKTAFHYLQQSLALDPQNVDAILGHAQVVAKIYDQGFVIRNVAEAKLNISFKDEAQKAKINLERVHQTDTPTYKKILDIL